jgi:hypothetical protein
MDAAYLLIAAKRDGVLSRHLSLATDPTPSGLHFTPNAHAVWRSRRNDVVVAGWRSTSDPRTAGAWHFSADQATLTTAPVRVQGEPWAADSRWAEQLANRGRGVADMGDELRGIFTVVSLDRDGLGEVVSDPLGFSFTYLGEDTDLLVVGSRAELVARALAGPACRRPPLDPVGVCGLAYSGYRIGNRTGYEGVRTLEAGDVVQIRGLQSSGVVSSRLPWMPDTDAGAVDGSEPLDVILSEIIDIASTTLSLPAERHLADLTGGKDSRLLLAALLHAGIADRFVFRTDGSDELADVKIARGLADTMGLDYEASLRFPGHSTTYVERLEAFVAISGGVVNCWDTKAATADLPRVRLSGLTGECLRAHSQVTRTMTSVADLERYLNEVLRFGRLGLVRPEVATAYEEAAHALLLADHPGHPLDRLESFQIRTRARARYGPLDELDRDHRVAALYSIDAIRAAFSLPPEERHRERVHFELMRRVAPDLVSHPFAGPGWSPHLQPQNTSPEASSAVPAGAPRPGSLMAMLRRSAAGDNRDALREIVASRTNPAWDLLDQDRTIDAVERIDVLDPGSRTELFGAVTAALWFSTNEHT